MELIITIEPPPCFFISGITCCVSRSVPSTFTSKGARHFSRSALSTGT